MCNHFRVMAAWSRKSWKKVSTFGAFGKATLTGKFFKILFRKDSLPVPHWSVCGMKISWNLADGKSVKSCVAYLTKKQKFASLSRSRYCVDRAQNLPGSVPDNVLRVLQISSRSVHFWRSY